MHLGWEPRRVVDALAAGRPLRSKVARELLIGLLKMRPGNAVATDVLHEAFELVGSSIPAVFIPPQELDHLAEYLANELSRLPGFGPKRRDGFERDVRYAIGRTAVAMAKAFYSACWARSEGDAHRRGGSEALRIYRGRGRAF